MDERLPLYACHKWVRAAKIVSIDMDPERPTGGFGAWADLNLANGVVVRVEGEFLSKHSPSSGTYYVTYADGYASISPAKAFEEGYKLAASDSEQQALSTLHAGAFTQRSEVPQ